MSKKTKRTLDENELDNYSKEGKKAAPTADPLEHYQSDSAIDQSYRSQQERLNTAKRNAQQNASVSLELLKKYLPVQNQTNGMTGLGVSESAGIDAYNQYVTRMGEIEQTHAAESAALLENYRTEQKGAQDAVYQEAMTMLESGTYNSFEELDQYLNSVRAKVSAEQMAQLDHLANYLKNNPDEIANMEAIREAREAQEASSASGGVVRTGAYYSSNGGMSTNLGNGDNFVIEALTEKKSFTDGLGNELQTDGKKHYEIQSGGEVNDQSVLNASQKYGKNTVFLYDGKIYMNRGGKVYLIEGRAGNNNSKDYIKLFNYLQSKE